MACTTKIIMYTCIMCNYVHTLTQVQYVCTVEFLNEYVAKLTVEALSKINTFLQLAYNLWSKIFCSSCESTIS